MTKKIHFPDPIKGFDLKPIELSDTLQEMAKGVETLFKSLLIWDNPYLVAHNDGTMIGGMMLKDGNVPDNVMPCWDQYVTVNDVETWAKMVENLGGELVLPPTEIPKVGRFCVIKDPQGISLNLITYADVK